VSDYPTEADLLAIESWKFNRAKSYRNLAQFVCAIWHWPERARLYGSWLQLHTGGWSGNEEIVSALKTTMFWMLCWQKSERGGHYYFRLPVAKQFDK